MLDWDRFKSLPGLDADNFEKLCRSIVRRRFGKFGPLIERKNQPGVEFYLELNRDSTELGDIGNKVGWQCKWFEVKANGELTASGKKQILHSLQKTDEHVADLTRWILWTRFTLAKCDQDWFYNLNSNYSYQLELWNAGDIESALDGPALELRGTYFGELALTPDSLAHQHQISVAPIRERWIKEVHQQFDVEKKIRQYLGEPSAWNEFIFAGESLEKMAKEIEESATKSTYADWEDILKAFSISCFEFVGFTTFFDKSISGDDLASIGEMVRRANLSFDEGLRVTLRQLRKRNLPLALYVTNALAFMDDIKTLLSTVLKSLSLSFIAVLADAGGGKTQMAAQITAPQPNRPAGVMLHGRQLRMSDSLDDLVKTMTFHGQLLPSFSALLAALDAAAFRANCRLPLFIDGLNEAANPKEWKALLAVALEQLKHYPNLLLVCTLRTGERSRYGHHTNRNDSETRETFAQMALPEECDRLQCKGFGQLTGKAIGSYFRHYKIETDFSQIPEDFFNHPLNLRIFCEVTNRNAEKVVHIDRFPASITTLFHNQVDYAAKRISELPNLQPSLSTQDVWMAIYHLGMLLWEVGERHVCENQFLEKLNQRGRVWDQNIVNLLAQEGILFRDPSDEPYSFLLTPTYDRLGGYIIADALLKRYSNDKSGNWIKDPVCIDRLFNDGGSGIDRLCNDGATNHLLSEDIIHALIALLPQKSPKQFWMLVPEEFKNRIIELSTLIDADNFCDQTEAVYKQQILSQKIDYQAVARIKALRVSGSHPLNADFFSSVLAELSMPVRDLSWTEYLRINHDEQIAEIQSFAGHWQLAVSRRTEGDRLRARWISWLLTSACLDVRDHATKALYWYGRGAARPLFDMTIESLAFNDPYVPERLLAASYGVVLFNVATGGGLADVEWLAEQLYSKMFAATAIAPTTHILVREYACKVIVFANKFSPKKFNRDQIDTKHPYSSMPRRAWGRCTSDGIGSSPFKMDFENYTIGRLVPGRRNYDYDNSEYKEIRSKILWRVRDLGWDYSAFADADDYIQSNSGYQRQSYNGSRIERYGKKYSWIAYYEMAGQLLDEEKLELWDGRFEMGIDPNFPEEIERVSDDATQFIGNAEVETKDWLTNSSRPNLNSVLEVEALNGQEGPWVLLNGYIVEESKRLDRNFYADVRAFFLDDEPLIKLRAFYDELGFEMIQRPDIAEVRSIYAGELYWCDCTNMSMAVQFEVTVGHEFKQIEQPIIKCHKNDDSSLDINISIDGKHFANVEMPKVKFVDAYQPVAQYSLGAENSCMSAINEKILTQEFTTKLELAFDPSTLGYNDAAGKLAVQRAHSKGALTATEKSLLYIRKDLLERFLSDESLNLLWCVEGERSLVRMTSMQDGEERYVQFGYEQPFDAE